MTWMRKLLKILFAIVIVACGYLFWPSTPAYTCFDPEALAKADVAAWKMASSGMWWQMGWKDYRIFVTELRYSHFSAMRMAWYYTRATRSFEETREAGTPEGAYAFLLHYFSVIRSAQGADINVEALARGELFLWMQASSPHPPKLAMVQVVADQWAGVAGGDPKDYLPGAERMVMAAEAYGRGPLGELEAQRLLMQGYRMLLKATRASRGLADTDEG